MNLNDSRDPLVSFPWGFEHEAPNRLVPTSSLHDSPDACLNHAAGNVTKS